jgi:mannosyltransferase
VADVTAHDGQDPTGTRSATPWWVTAVVVLMVAAGVVARFLPRGALWLDEALSANIAQLPLGDIREALERDGHPPLYYVLLHAWSAVVGTSPWAMRLLSGLLGVAALPLAWWAGLRVGGRPDVDGRRDPVRARRTGLAALVLLATLPFAIRYSSETRMYSLLMLLVLVGYLLVDHHRERPQWSTAIGTAVVAGLLLWTHYWSLWLLGALGVVLLVQALVEHRRGDTSRRDAELGLAAALVVGGLSFLPWLPTMLYQSAHTGTPWGDVVRPAAFGVIGMIQVFGGAVAEPQMTAYLVAGLMVLGLFGATNAIGRVELGWRIRPTARREGVVVGAALALAWIASFVSRSAFEARYLAVVVPLVVLIAAMGLTAIGKDAWRRIIAVVVVAGFAVGVLVEVGRVRSQAGEVGDAVVEVLAAAPAGSPEPLVVTCPDQNGPSVERALRDRGAADRVEVVTVPRLDDPRFVDWVDYADRNAAIDPVEVGLRIVERAEGRTLFYAVTENYKTLEGKCEGIQTALIQARGAPLVLVAPDDRNQDEPGMTLLEFPAP